MIQWRKNYTPRLKALAEKHNFLLFEDRKFIEFHTAGMNQLFNSPFQILEWTDLISATTFIGQGCVKALTHVIEDGGHNVGVILLAEAATRGGVTHSAFTEDCVRVAKEFPTLVLGFIALGKLTDDDETDLLTFATDIDLHNKTDGFIMKCQTPLEAIQRGADVLFVGKPFWTNMGKPWQDQNELTQTAVLYKRAGWRAHLKMVHVSQDQLGMEDSALGVEESNFEV
jgi:orotidine-5'-phosphate decarboxylase